MTSKGLAKWKIKFSPYLMGQASLTFSKTKTPHDNISLGAILGLDVSDKVSIGVDGRYVDCSDSGIKDGWFIGPYFSCSL